MIAITIETLLEMGNMVYLSFKPNSIKSLEKCKESLKTYITDIRKQMRTNKLKLNDDVPPWRPGSSSKIIKVNGYVRHNFI